MAYNRIEELVAELEKAHAYEASLEEEIERLRLAARAACDNLADAIEYLGGIVPPKYLIPFERVCQQLTQDIAP